jgi:hypothetical protein
MSRNITDLVEAKNYLATVTGVIIYSVKDCSPCEILWEVIEKSWKREECVTKITLDHRIRDNCSFLRERRVSNFPTILLMKEGNELCRLNGINISDPDEAIMAYIETGLKLGEEVNC